MPPFAARTIPRQRVTAVLEEALASHCLAVLTAPAGYGKTTAARELMGRWDTRSFYLAMKPGWRDNAAFLWKDACARLEEQGALKAEALKLMGMPDDDARLYHCLALCRECLAGAPALLVMDDFQHVEAPEVNRFLASLVREEIPGFNLLLLSRAKPALPLESLRMQGHTAVLDQDLLAFSREETRRMFALAGEQSYELADIAHDFSRGWAAALRICLQSHLAGGGIRPVRNIEELLAETFFTAYSEEDQCLLLKLSVLESFSAAQASFLCGENDVPLRLRRLYGQNAFLLYSPVDDAYAIHGLLRAYLLARLAENSLPVRGEMDLPLLYRRAGECCLQSGNQLQAMRHFAQAGEEEDLLRILRMFETPGEGFFMTLDPEAVIGIIETIPWAIRDQCPIGYLGFIHRYMVRVNTAAAGDMLDEARERFLGNSTLPEEMRRTIRGEIELVGAARSFNDIAAMCRCYEKADTLLQGNSSLVDKGMFWTFNCPHSAFLYLKEPGTYQWLETLIAEKLIHFQNVSGGSNAGAADLLAAERLLETGAKQKAPHLIAKAGFKAAENAQYPGILAAHFTSARLQLAEGRADIALELLHSLRDPLEQLANPLLLHALEVCQGYIAAICNDTGRIPAWLLQREPHAITNNQTHAFSLIVRGKAIMAMKNWSRLEAFAEEAERQTAPLGCLFGRLHILLFKAVAALHTQRHSTAFAEECLMRALELARPDGIVTSIAEYGVHLYPFLQRLCNFHPERRDLVPLSRLTKRYARLDRKRASPLTLHEMDIMELVHGGASNREIGARLGITPGSAANSLSRIYNKLGVGSRIEAIHKWTEESALRAEEPFPG